MDFDSAEKYQSTHAGTYRHLCQSACPLDIHLPERIQGVGRRLAHHMNAGCTMHDAVDVLQGLSPICRCSDVSDGHLAAVGAISLPDQFPDLVSAATQMSDEGMPHKAIGTCDPDHDRAICERGCTEDLPSVNGR